MVNHELTTHTNLKQQLNIAHGKHDNNTGQWSLWTRPPQAHAQQEHSRRTQSFVQVRINSGMTRSTKIHTRYVVICI